MRIENRGDGWRCSACGYEPVVVENFLSFSPESVETGVAEFNDAVYTRMAALEVRSFYFQARRALILWVLRNYFPGMKNYYDLGTGTGWLFAAVMETWPKLEMVGSDLAFDSLRWTSKRLTRPAMLMHCDVNRIPYADEFDVVGAYDVIEHIDDDVQALRSIRNAVKPGGGMILTVPQHMVLWNHLDRSPAIGAVTSALNLPIKRGRPDFPWRSIRVSWPHCSCRNTRRGGFWRRSSRRNSKPSTRFRAH